MSRRSIIISIAIGLFLTILLSTWCYFNDSVIRSGLMISSLLPPIAYGGLVIFLLVLNPLLRRVRKGIALKGHEVAIILGIFLIACGIPGWGLTQMLTSQVMFPHHDQLTNASWKSENVIAYAPEEMLCDADGQEGADAVNGFVTGLATGDRHINPFSDIPWSAWGRPMRFWLPLCISFLVAIMGLAAVLNRQWSDHEQLPYPIVQFVSSMFPDEEGGLSQIFRNKLFIIGFSVAFLILLDNYLCRWFPDAFIPIKLRYDFSPAMKLLPIIIKGKGAMLFYPTVIMSVVGLAYFLPSDVSLSMWFAPWLYCLVAGIFATYGIELRSGKMMALSHEMFIFSGGYFAIMLMIAYTGRHFYWNTLKRSLGFKGGDDVPEYTVLGMRLFLIGALLFIIQLRLVGVPMLLGTIYAVFAFMVYIVVSRILAETGGYNIGTFVYPCVILWGMFGASFLGPGILVTLFMVSTVFLAAPGWCLMPFANQAFKLAEVTKDEKAPGRMLKWGIIAMLLAMAVSIPCTMYWQYDKGAMISSWPHTSSVYPFANTVEIVHTLKLQGFTEMAKPGTGLGGFANLRPSGPHIFSFVLTMVLALLVGFGRLKYTWWPIHPMVFIFLGSGAGMLMSFSFGLGFAIKALVTKYGGGRMYQECKPAMVGLVAGTLTGEFIPMLVGTIYYFSTGKTI